MKIKEMLFFDRLGDHFGTTNLFLAAVLVFMGGAFLFYGVSSYLYRQELWSLTTMFRPRPEPIFWAPLIISCCSAGLVLLGLVGIVWGMTGLIRKRQAT